MDFTETCNDSCWQFCKLYVEEAFPFIYSIEVFSFSVCGGWGVGVGKFTLHPLLVELQALVEWKTGRAD